MNKLSKNQDILFFTSSIKYSGDILTKVIANSYSQNIADFIGLSHKDFSTSVNPLIEFISEKDRQSVIQFYKNILLKGTTEQEISYTINGVRVDESLHLLNRDNLNEFAVVWRKDSSNKELSPILNVLNDFSDMGIAIYRDKILYINKGFTNITGYSQEEIDSIEIKNFFHKTFLNQIESNIKRRLEGEDFLQTFSALPIFKKDGSVIFVNSYSSTIRYKDNFAVCSIFFDETQNIYNRYLNIITNKVIHLSSVMYDTDEFIIRLLKFIKLNPFIYSFFYKAKPDGSIDNTSSNFRDIFDCKRENENCLSYQMDIFNKLNRETLLLFPSQKDIEESFSCPIIKSNIKSACLIKLPLEDKYSYIIMMYSTIPNFFSYHNASIIKSIYNRLSRSISYITTNNNTKILMSALQNSLDWVLITDNMGKIVYVNKTVEKLTGYSKVELIGNTPSVLKSGYYDKEFYNNMWKTLESGNPFSCVILNKNKNGGTFKLEHLILPVKLGNTITHYVAFARDLERMDKLQGEIYELKFKDALTGLLNRYGFKIEGSRFIDNFIPKDKKEVVILILIDIYNFSHINNIHSEDIGDAFLIDFSKIIKSLFNDEDIIGRTGGDEFAILKVIKENTTRGYGKSPLTYDSLKKDEIDGIQKDVIIDYVESIIEAFKFVRITDKGIISPINIGVSIFPYDASNIEDILNQARIALSISKNMGENRYSFFNEDFSHGIKKRDTIQGIILDALVKDWFNIVLQPYFDSESKEIAGMEALLRIEHPEKGLLLPGYFIDILENSELIFEVEIIIINKIKNILISWLDKGLKVVPISLNITGRSFKNEIVMKTLKDAADTFNKPLIKLEIIERLFLEDIDYALDKLKNLKESNIAISLDDFGTGYSSLSYVAAIPMDQVKIDISFVRRMLEDKKSFHIVEIIILMAKKLGVKTVAEGVESEDQYNILKTLGCDYIQGYYFAKPMSVNDAQKYLE